MNRTPLCSHTQNHDKKTECGSIPGLAIME